MNPVPSAPALESNLRRFIVFRLFFNARFYYPVFAVLFLDYGLTLEQFAILNMVWAVSIVLAEVPSGALADLLGRRRLLVFAAWLMFIEMALLATVPIGASPLLFAVFLINRVCSGLAEAAASGADEALAYDSLKALGREKDWSRLLEKTARTVSAGFFATMIIGAFAYDSRLINSLLGHLPGNLQLDRDLVIRLPVILTLLTSGIVIWAVIGMREPSASDNSPAAPSTARGQAPAARGQELSGEVSLWGAWAGSFAQIVAAARWTLGHRFVLFVILAALVLDSVARQFVVLGSEYYRMIEIPPAWFGFIGAGIALIGIPVARLGRYLADNHAPLTNYLSLSALLLFGLVGVAFTLPWVGVVFAVCCFAVMNLTGFQSSYYINREVDSARRATVLSFRGLAMNLGLGMASLFYTLLVAGLKAGEEPGLEAGALQNRVFVDSLKAFPLYFAVLAVLILILGRLFIRRRQLCVEAPLGRYHERGDIDSGNAR